MGAAAPLIGLQVGTSILQSQAQLSQSEFQSNMMKMNAREADRYAQRMIEQGDVEVLKYKKQGNQLIGKQRAAYGSSGIDVGYGTAKAVQEETAMTIAQDVETIKTNAFLQAMGYKAQAQDMNRQADFNRRAGQFNSSMTLLAGGLNAINTYRNS